MRTIFLDYLRSPSYNLILNKKIIATFYFGTMLEKICPCKQLLIFIIFKQVCLKNIEFSNLHFNRYLFDIRDISISFLCKTIATSTADVGVPFKKFSISPNINGNACGLLSEIFLSV